MASGSRPFPSDAFLLERCQPVYETHAGWTEDLIGRPQAVRPARSRPAVTWIGLANWLGCPCPFVSVGPDRSQTIMCAMTAPGVTRKRSWPTRPPSRRNSPCLPRHIAIIMDGNGRWAHERGLERVEGHLRGAETVRRIVEECCRLGIGQLTLYCLSSENWKRPQRELDFLMTLLKQYLVDERPEIWGRTSAFASSAGARNWRRTLLRRSTKPSASVRATPG